MQPRRGARGGGKAANPNAWLGSAWGGAMGRFSAGAGGAKPAVIRVGTTFQADVPPWRGPAALDGSEAADVGRNAPPASEAHSPRVLAPLADAERPKKSARVSKPSLCARAASVLLPGPVTRVFEDGQIDARSVLHTGIRLF